MKKTLFVLLAAALTTLALGASADEPVIERHVKLKIVTDAGEPLDLDLGDMEVGETRQFFTDNGVEVTVTRLEEAFEILVDGEDEPLVVALPEGPHGDHDFDYDFGCEGDDCGQHVIIRKVLHGDEHGTAVFHGDDGQHVIIEHSEDVSWVDGGDGDGSMMIHTIGDDPTARLIESGALDDLSPEKRHEILEALRGAHEGHGKQIRVIKRKAGDANE